MRPAQGEPGLPAAHRAGWRAARRHPLRTNGSGDRFGLLLLVLMGSYVISAFLTGTWVTAVQTVLFMVVAALAVRTSRVKRRTVRRTLLVLIAGSVAAVLLALTHSADAAGAASLWTAFVLLFAVILIVRRVLTHRVITLQSIFGAVSAYMIIGLMFAAVYAALNRFGGGGFFTGGAEASIKTFQYFSFTTLTTLGYGDFTAAGSGGRAVAVMEALIGQVFLATLVARLVAAFQPASRAATGRRGPPGRGPRRLVPGRQRSPHRRAQPGTPSGSAATRIPSRGRERPARK